MEYLVIDVGGTAIKYACMNENAEFLERGEIPTPMDSLDSYLAALGTIIHRYDHNVEGIWPRCWKNGMGCGYHWKMTPAVRP